jgi:hypothetical protein
LATGACAGNSNTLQLPYSIVLVQDSSGSLSLNGEDDFCATIDIDIQISSFTLQSFSATSSAGIDTSIGLSDTVQGAFSSTQDLPALVGNTIEILIGDLPIGLTPTLTPFVGASGSASATVSTGVTTSTTATLGVSYANGQWSPVDTVVSPTAVSATTSAEANASIKGLAGVRLGVNVDQPFIPGTSATVSLSGDGYLQLTAGLKSNPCWSLDGGIEGALGISAEVLGKNLPSYSSGTLGLYSTNIAKATGPCYTVTVSPANQNIDVGDAVKLSAQETDLLGNTVAATFNWSTSAPTVATVDSSGNVSAVGPGTVTITATDPVTTVSGTATVVVGEAAPTYFLTGDWAGTFTYLDAYGTTTTYNVGASFTQTATSFSGTLTGLSTGNLPVTYTVTGTISGNNVSFTIGSTDGTTADATNSVSANGLQVNGSGVDGSNGSIVWNGNSLLTGNVLIAAGSTDIDASQNLTFTGTIQTNGQTLTGGATASDGETAQWTLTLQ